MTMCSEEGRELKKGVMSTGFVRRLDPLGRLNLPIEWRRTFAVEPGARIEILPNSDGSLLIRRYIPAGTCTFCGGVEEILHFAGRPICHKCTAQLAAGLGA